MSIENLELTVIVATRGCSDSTCPTVYSTNRGTRIVQGSTVERTTIAGLPGHESAVEVPDEFYNQIGEAWAREHGLMP